MQLLKKVHPHFLPIVSEALKAGIITHLLN